MVGVDPVDMAERQHQYLAVAADRGLPAKPSKVVAPSVDGVEVLGLHLVGRTYTLAPRVDKLHQLRLDTAALVRRITCTGRELATIVGRWTWFMLCSRPALACFSAVYAFTRYADRKAWVLWDSVKRELQHVIDLSPLFRSYLGASWHHSVMATDASLTGLGVVAAVVPPALVEVAARTAGSVAINTCSLNILLLEGEGCVGTLSHFSVPFDCGPRFDPVLSLSFAILFPSYRCNLLVFLLLLHCGCALCSLVPYTCADTTPLPSRAGGCVTLFAFPFPPIPWPWATLLIIRVL